MVVYVRQTRRSRFFFFLLSITYEPFRLSLNCKKKKMMMIIVAKRRNVVVFFVCVSSERNQFVVELGYSNL